MSPPGKHIKNGVV